MRLAHAERYNLLEGKLSWGEIMKGNLQWLSGSLVATELARERTKKWIDGGGLDRPSLSTDEIRRRLVYSGDEAIFEPAVYVLERIAPPAQDLILRHAALFGVGCPTLGWAWTATAEIRGIVIVVATVDPKTLAHECAHCFLHMPTKRQEVLSTEQRRGKAATMELLGPLHGKDLTEKLIEKPKRQREREADRLATDWGFPGKYSATQRVRGLG